MRALWPACSTLASYALPGHAWPCPADGDLVKFAHSCDYDVSQAKQCVRAFLETRRQAPEIFSGWDTDTPNMRSIFDVM